MKSKVHPLGVIIIGVLIIAALAFVFLIGEQTLAAAEACGRISCDRYLELSGNLALILSMGQSVVFIVAVFAVIVIVIRRKLERGDV